MDAVAPSFDREAVLGWTGPVSAPVFDPWVPSSTANVARAPNYVVGPENSGARFDGIQGAIDQAIRDAEKEDPCQRRLIQVLPGWFSGPVCIPKAAPPLTICGSGRSKTILAARIDAQMPGREYQSRFSDGFSGSPAPVKAHFARVSARETVGTGYSAVLRIERDDTIITDLSVENLYACDRPSAAPAGDVPDVSGRFANGQHQAVALHVAGADRVALRDLHLSSYQDTLYLQSPSPFEVSRVFLSDCRVEGDIDFVFGGATAYFDNCELRARFGRVAKGWTLAPSTNLRAPFGFVFDNCEFTSGAGHDAEIPYAYLGRQWFEGVRATPYGTPSTADYRCDFGPISQLCGGSGIISKSTLEAVGKCAVVNSSLGQHLNKGKLWDGWCSSEWNSRFRPAQHSARDFLDRLGAWIHRNGLSYEDIDPNERWLVFDEAKGNADQFGGMK